MRYHDTGVDEFQSPTRSTVLLFSLLKHGNELWNNIVNELITPCSHLKGHLEFTVKPPCGRGKASHTDLMLTSRNQSVAFEAKWTEPKYETVNNWLGSENRREVMTGWLSLIQPHVAKTLSAEDVGDAVYQMVHRAASACFASRIPTLAYIQFSPLPNGSSQEPTVIRDLAQLHTLLGVPDTLRFYLVEVLVAPTKAFEAIRALPKSSPATTKSVITALRNGPLFRFVDFRVHHVRGGKSQRSGCGK